MMKQLCVTLLLVLIGGCRTASTVLSVHVEKDLGPPIGYQTPYGLLPQGNRLVVSATSQL